MRSAVSRFASATAIIAVTALAFSAPLIGEMALAKGPPAAVEDRAGPAGDYPMVLGAPFVVDGVTYTAVPVATTALASAARTAPCRCPATWK